ncbi:hypothetical protein CEXT_432411 [Caerostris extrusa]|uniref:Uncharacterized protein n=1 Tax=Caerostris extrusa TaxID=172846 RepID=A0AAV4QFB0_CAEEX|nr:hypothetical protein CEXT_432411 [Caerostris extrusa]
MDDDKYNSKVHQSYPIINFNKGPSVGVTLFIDVDALAAINKENVRSPRGKMKKKEIYIGYCARNISSFFFLILFIFQWGSDIKSIFHFMTATARCSRAANGEESVWGGRQNSSNGRGRS